MVLRERFGMTYQQAQFEEPEWYVEMLLRHHRTERFELEQAAAREVARLAELERTDQQFQQDMKAAGLA